MHPLKLPRKPLLDVQAAGQVRRPASIREEGFSLQSNAETLEGKQHPDRDAQFHYFNEEARP